MTLFPLLDLWSCCRCQALKCHSGYSWDTSNNSCKRHQVSVPFLILKFIMVVVYSLFLFSAPPLNIAFPLFQLCSPKFKSFSYLYDEDHFIHALSSDVVIVHGLPKDLREARKKIKFPTVSPRNSATAEYYIKEVLPRLVKSKVLGIIVNGGNCLQVSSTPMLTLFCFSFFGQCEVRAFPYDFLQSILPASLEEFQKLRCRVAFHALRLRPQIQALGSQIVGRWGSPPLPLIHLLPF